MIEKQETQRDNLCAENRADTDPDNHLIHSGGSDLQGYIAQVAINANHQVILANNRTWLKINAYIATGRIWCLDRKRDRSQSHNLPGWSPRAVQKWAL